MLSLSSSSSSSSSSSQLPNSQVQSHPSFLNSSSPPASSSHAPVKNSSSSSASLSAKGSSSSSSSSSHHPSPSLPLHHQRQLSLIISPPSPHEISSSSVLLLQQEFISYACRRCHGNRLEALSLLDSVGYQIGIRLLERLSLKFHQRLFEQRECLKFICKDVWFCLFQKQADRLQTNRRGGYVIQDHSLPPLRRLSYPPSFFSASSSSFSDSSPLPLYGVGVEAPSDYFSPSSFPVFSSSSLSSSPLPILRFDPSSSSALYDKRIEGSGLFLGHEEGEEESSTSSQRNLGYPYYPSQEDSGDWAGREEEEEQERQAEGVEEEGRGGRGEGGGGDYRGGGRARKKEESIVFVRCANARRVDSQSRSLFACHSCLRNHQRSSRQYGTCMHSHC